MSNFFYLFTKFVLVNGYFLVEEELVGGTLFKVLWGSRLYIRKIDVILHLTEPLLSKYLALLIHVDLSPDISIY